MAALQLRETWSAAVNRLAEPGWVRLPEALAPAAIRSLIDAPHPSWHDLPEEEGVVRQHGRGSYLGMDACADAIKAFASEVVGGVSVTAEAQGWPPVPMFNEVTWTHYPDGTGHITSHRDPPAYGGVIVVTTLVGRARFSVLGNDRSSEWLAAPGDVVLLRGRGWPSPDSRCPRHGVEPPSGGDRMIMTMRFNTRGAGAAYF
jgi:hypothetical protein